MFKPIQFPIEVENLVHFVEETEPDRIIKETLTKLRDGVSPREMLRASALAVVRSTELPASHHGGPVHPICGVHGCYHTSQRLPGELAFMPIVQHVALCNHHIQSRHMGPYIMPELEPMDGSVEAPYETYLDRESSIVHMGSKANREEEGDLQAFTIEAFLSNIEAQRPVAAEQYYLWLQEKLSPGQILDHMLPGFISTNHLDDHNVLYPVLTARALDCIGWEWAPVLMRPVVRYQARNVNDLTHGKGLDFSTVEAVLDEYRLLEIDIPFHTTQEETGAIGELAARIGANRHFYGNIEMMAKALADGLSLEGAGEALSVGASTVFLSTSYGNPMDSHLHTGVNTRRYLLNMPGISLRNKVLALLTGITGPECTVSEGKMNWSPHIDPESLAALPHRTQDALVDAISENIENQTWADWKTNPQLDHLVAPTEIRDTIALAQQYVSLGYSPLDLFVRLGELICRDDFTELHAVKQHQALVDEFNTTREPFRSVHLVAAAKSAAIVHSGREHKIYTQARELLKV